MPGSCPAPLASAGNFTSGGKFSFYFTRDCDRIRLYHGFSQRFFIGRDLFSSEKFMVFADLLFLYLFLPVNLILYYLTRNYGFRNFVLVAMSFLFYA